MKKRGRKVITVAVGCLLSATVGCVCQIGKIETCETSPRATFWRSNDIGGSTNAVDTAMEGGGNASARMK